jgi:hypothetical protein
MREDDEPTDEEIYGELARRFSIAYTSTVARLAYSTVEKRLKDQGPPGSFWIELAKRVTHDVQEAADEDQDDSDEGKPPEDGPLN